MFCKNCGSEMNGSFCTKCGAPAYQPTGNESTGDKQQTETQQEQSAYNPIPPTPQPLPAPKKNNGCLKAFSIGIGSIVALVIILFLILVASAVNDFFAFLFVFFVVAVPVCVVAFIVQVIRKKKKLGFAIAAIVCVIGSVASMFAGSSDYVESMTPEERAAYEAQLAEEQAQKEAEKAAEEAEKAAQKAAEESSKAAEEAAEASSKAVEEAAESSRAAEEEASRIAEEEAKKAEEEKLEQERQEETSSQQVKESVDDIIPGLTQILETVGIEPKDAEDIEQIEDWVNGSRYRFNSRGTSVFVFCNMDSTVNTIKIGNATTGIELYKQGYETWHFDNFIIDDDMQIALQVHTEDAVKACLNYPSTADFSLWDWSYSREFNHYQVSGSVEAQNAFGVKEEIRFMAQYYNDESLKIIYLEVDGVVAINTTTDYPLPERKETGDGLTGGTSQNGEIRIVEGQLGEYGEYVDLDGYLSCWYYVPKGVYTVKSNAKWCVVCVDKNEITRNSDGAIEMENVIRLEMNHGDEQQVTISQDEHIFLTIGADITLIPSE